MGWVGVDLGSCAMSTLVHPALPTHPQLCGWWRVVLCGCVGGGVGWMGKGEAADLPLRLVQRVGQCHALEVVIIDKHTPGCPVVALQRVLVAQ